ncbi:helix-turn-helix domain-containing protein [Streptomyces sp. AP-93]|uniref:AraC-like ligand-binding domain-containing protein n=1 Tax=Streptomyces sp. AP-93 TaxID=2929048 RepID=UPI001FAF629A|nr:helix-turn-helix domain-containing protein [Streptomyces sp. AP-93]MCJ0873470.1 helix-turn-helix domain-containing protein [Streptomyces sp. AP-93]
MWTKFSTEHLSGTDRYDFWDAMVSSSLFRTTVACDHREDFAAGSAALDLGDVQTFAQYYPSMKVSRSPLLVRQHDPEVVHLWLTVRGRIGMTQSGREVEVGEGDLLFYDSSKPWQGWTDAMNRPDVSSLIVQVPRTALPLHSNTLDRLIHARIPGRTGIGGLLRRYLTGLMDHASEYEACDAPRLAHTTLDLLSAMLAEAARAREGLSPETQHNVMRIRINEFIRRRLGDPGLCPATIAAAHQISLRTLYRLFQQQGTTVAARIRHERLERCRADLADPLMRSRSIHAIAAGWGFTRPADFTRAFRAAYGLPPSDYRHLAGRAPADLRAPRPGTDRQLVGTGCQRLPERLPAG